VDDNQSMLNQPRRVHSLAKTRAGLNKIMNNLSKLKNKARFGESRANATEANIVYESYLRYGGPRTELLVNLISMATHDQLQKFGNLRLKEKDIFMRWLPMENMAIGLIFLEALRTPTGLKISRRQLRKPTLKNLAKIYSQLEISTSKIEMSSSNSREIMSSILEKEYSKSIVSNTFKYLEENNLDQAIYFKEIIEAFKYAERNNVPIEWVLSGGLSEEK